MLFHLAWRSNLDSYDVALAVNRLAARGTRLWWLGAAGAGHEAGDYLCDVDANGAERLYQFGLAAVPWRGPAPDGAVALAAPRIALFCGSARPAPGALFYAAALARLGFDVAPVDGAAIAAGVLAGHDIVVCPAGMAADGIDAGEGVSGADGKLRDFLAAGGGAIGSGEGAFYLAAGRPGATGTARSRPLYEPGARRPGSGIVSLLLDADAIALGCPPTVAVPYDCGPVFDRLDRADLPAATYDRLIEAVPWPGAAPLDEAGFARELAGRTAILRAEGPRGRAVLFAPNPEIGGDPGLEAPSWRLILNAVHSLMLRSRPPLGAPAPLSLAAPDSGRAGLAETLAAALGGGGLAGAERDALARRLDRAVARGAEAEAALDGLDGPAAAIRGLRHAYPSGGIAAPADAKPAERLHRIAAGITLLETWCRLAEAELHFAGAGTAPRRA